MHPTARLSRALALPFLLLAAVPAALPAQAVTFRDAARHGFGERITTHAEVERYVERLSVTSDRVKVIYQGMSWERRGLYLVAVSAPENIARLEEIRENSLRLGDPRRTDAAAARAIIANQPVVMWFGGSIHGFELSGTEGALKLLEHLTTRNDPATMEALRRTVVLIDPMLNPDGRDAFAAINHENIGGTPASDPNDWSNDFTGWQALKFRTGHYYFDTNRDWFAHTQRETRDRMPWLHQWRPQVATDMHEQGSNAEFYFDPPGEPTNPHMPAFTNRWFRIFGPAYATAFDSAGFEYFSRERYNYFYPGYTSNRGYQGAIAMLFEQGSTRGLAGERGDGTVRTLADALEQQYLAAWTAVRVASGQRERLLTEYYESQASTIADGTRGVRRYLIPDTGDRTLVRELVDLLRRNDIEVGVLTAEARLQGVTDRSGGSVAQRAFPAGTYVIEASQPSGRLIRALLDPQVPMPPEFLTQARAFVERDENPRFYDITGWSLPLLFNVEAYGATDARPVTTGALPEAWTPPPVTRAGYAYLVDGSATGAAAIGARLKLMGHRAGYLFKATRVGTTEVPAGSIIVRVGQNDGTIRQAVADLAREYGVRVISLDRGLGEPGGPDFGSGDWTFNLRTPRIAMLAEDPISGYSFGWTWYTLDQQYRIPVTVIRTRSVAGTPLDDYNVLIIPEASATGLADLLGENGRTRIQRWVRDGGTLVTLGSATDFARAQLNLSLRNWYDTDAGKNKQRFGIPGAVFGTRVDLLHWATGGYGSADLPVLANSSRLYLPPEGPPNSQRRVIATYASGTPISGHAWDETKERIPGTVFAYEERVGSGRVITFSEDPNFRAYWRGANRLFLNAVLLGPSAP